MKLNILRSVVLILSVSSIFTAQDAYSQKLDFDVDTVEFIPGDGKIVNGYINVQNQNADSISVEWAAVENTLNPDWYLQFCDFENCFTNDFDPLKDSNSGMIPDGYNNQWYLGVDLAGHSADSAVWIVEVNYPDIGEKDTLVWIVSTLQVGVPENNKTEHPLSLYPNPASDRLNINAPGFSGTAFRVLDISGKEMQTGILNSENEVLNIEHLPDGLYFLSVQSEGGTQVHKFIKQ